MGSRQFLFQCMAPREIYKPSGTPEEPENIKRLEAMYGAEADDGKYENIEHYGPDFRAVDVQRVQDSLLRIDFVALQDMFESIGSKCGIDPTKLNFLPRDHIILKPSQSGNDGIAGYESWTNQIYISPTPLVSTVGKYDDVRQIKWPSHERLDLAKESSMYLFTLYTLIHEQVHAISFNRLVSWYPDTLIHRLKRLLGRKQEPEGYKEDQSGYGKTARDPQNQELKNFFEAFDEGVTEKLTLDILRKFLAGDSNSLTAEEKKRFFERFTIKSTDINYDAEIQLIDAFIECIAKKSGMDARTIWQAIVRSKVEGIDLEDTELSAFIDEHTFDGFVDRIKKLTADEYAQIENIRTCLKTRQDNSH